MSVQVVRNSRQGQESPMSPVHEDGTRYPFAMHFDGEKYIAYADQPEELLDCLIPGYSELSYQEQQVARIKLAISVQVTTQGIVNAETEPEVWDGLSEDELHVLNGPRFEQPRGWGDPEGLGDVWDSTVPLILVETGYAPYTDIDRPISGIADVIDPPNIVWLRPVDEWEFLTSLTNVGYVELFEATDI